MADSLSFDESIRTESFAGNGIYRCEKCDQFVPYRSLSEHFDLKHKDIEGDKSQCNESETIGQPKEQRHKQPIILERFLRTQRPRGNADQNDSIGSDVRHGYEQFGPINGNDNCSYDQTRLMGRHIDNDDSAFIDTSTPKNGHNSRSTRRFNDLMKLNKFDRVSTPTIESDGTVRRRSIPTAHELFNVRSFSEMRTTKPNHDINSMYGNGNTSSQLATPRRSSSMSRAQPIPDNLEQCRFCLNIMHQDYLEGHIERQHHVENEAIETDTPAKSKKAHKKTKNRATVKAIKAPKVEKVKENFIRCKLCDSLMHTDYLPGHLVRKHRTEHGGSVGIIWSQHTDDQLNKRLNQCGIFIKNRILYVDEHEFDE